MVEQGNGAGVSRRAALRWIVGGGLVAASGVAPVRRAGAAAGTVRVGVIKVPHWAATWIAPELMPKGAELKLVEFKTSLEIIAALTAGNLDVGTVGYWHFMRMLDQGQNVKAIAGVSSGGTRLVVRKDLEVQSWSDFRSKTVAVARGSTQDVQFLLALKKHGLSRNDISYRDLGGNMGVHINALQQKQIDASSMWEPFAAEVIKQDVAYEFSTLYEHSFRVNGLLFVTAEYLQKNRDLLQTFVEAQVKATDRLLKNFDEWTDLTVRLTGFSRDTMVLANKNSFLEYVLRMEDAKRMAAAIHELGYSKSDVSPKLDTAFDYSFIAKVTGKSPKELGA